LERREGELQPHDARVRHQTTLHHTVGSGIVMHTATAVIIGSSVFSATSGIDTYRLYITRRT
jgi:hypothetical protein